VKRGFAGLFLALLLSTAQAAVITEQYTVTLPFASGDYAAGHVFKITATYDNAGTVFNTWFDGSNDIAEFGSGDDTLFQTFTTAAYPNYSVFSNAVISISGIAPLPAGSVPRDVYDSNSSNFEKQVSPLTRQTLSVQADDIFMFLELNTTTASSPLWSFTVVQFYLDATGEPQNQGVTVQNYPGEVPRVTIPEPTTLALLGLGLAGLAAARRRKR